MHEHDLAGDKVLAFCRRRQSLPPFDELLERTPTDIPELRVRLHSDSIHVQIGAETLDIKRGEPITPKEGKL